MGGPQGFVDRPFAAEVEQGMLFDFGADSLVVHQAAGELGLSVFLGIGFDGFDEHGGNVSIGGGAIQDMTNITCPYFLQIYEKVEDRTNI